MVRRVPRSKQSNINAYIDMIKLSVPPDKRMKIDIIRQRAIAKGMEAHYTRQNINILQNVEGGRRLAGVIKKNRYDDVFEDLLQYEEIANTRDPQELEDAIYNLLQKGKHRQTGRAQRSARQNAGRLAQNLLDTPNARRYFVEKNVEQVSPERATVVERLVPENKRARVRELAKKKELYKVFDRDKGEIRLLRVGVFKVKGRPRRFTRDISSGRFTKTITHFRRQLFK